MREAVGFLLDRQPATVLPPELSLDDMADRFPDFGEELRARLA